ncbi:FAD-dependent monooxygenase [Streptomyces phaeochromogenes]|uniref:FAD-dependent monooxygenase n=2 Tax=Streptomyces phaeochromogenes TaxID=1923 RepID=UPI003868505B|nr:FAD-dependent monooxygenase [Streptomyces phaeochromogenes]
MTNATRVPLLIVGGGIGGMAAALAAARAGQQVRLLERAPAFTEIGAGLQVGPNAIRVLAGLGLYPQIEKVAVFPERGVFMDAVTGRHLTALDLGSGFRERYGAPYVVMHRSDLLDILLQACRDSDLVTLENGKEVTEVSDPASGAVHVNCADGSAYETEFLIGADGLNSAVRPLVVQDELVCSGYAAYRGTIPVGDAAEHIDGSSVVLWIGPGLHMIQYPIRRGELRNTVAVFRSDAFARGEDDWGGPDELDARFAGTCNQVRRGVQLVDRSRHWKTYDRDPADRFTAGRVALLGDAAHPMLQYLGQGACQALEDAEALGRLLGRHCGDYGRVLAAYEQERVPRATGVQRTARSWGEIWHTDGIGKSLRDHIFTGRAVDDYTHTDWLYLPSVV